MEGPAAGIVRIEGDGNSPERRHQDRVADRTREALLIEPDHLKAVAMQMHRMRHHGLVPHDKFHALAC